MREREIDGKPEQTREAEARDDAAIRRERRLADARRATWRRRSRRLAPFVRSRKRILADRPLSPAARLVIEGAIFDFGPDHFAVTDVHPSPLGRQADLLVLRGTDHENREGEGCARGIQVRDLEDLIEGDRIDIAFIGSARAYNRSKGWGRDGEPTLASLGITL